MSVQLGASEFVVAVEHLAPLTVAELAGLLGRPHDVGEQHGCQHAVGLVHRPVAGDELLDLVVAGIRIAFPSGVVLAR